MFTLYWRGVGVGGGPPSQKTACAENLQKIYVALQIYSADCAGKFPNAPGARTSEEPLDLLVPRYTAEPALFICPGSKGVPAPTGQSLRANRISYAFWMGRQAIDNQSPLLSDELVDTLPKTAGQAAFSNTGNPPGNNHGAKGGNFLFCDGSVTSTANAPDFPQPQPPGVVLLNPKR